MRSLAYFIGTFVVALMLGIGSAWYMIERGSPLTTTKVGPWASWISEGNPNADPYTRGACGTERQASPLLDRGPLFHGPDRQRRAHA